MDQSNLDPLIARIRRGDTFQMMISGGESMHEIMGKLIGHGWQVECRPWWKKERRLTMGDREVLVVKRWPGIMVTCQRI